MKILILALSTSDPEGVKFINSFKVDGVQVKWSSMVNFWRKGVLHFRAMQFIRYPEL